MVCSRGGSSSCGCSCSQSTVPSAARRWLTLPRYPTVFAITPLLWRAEDLLRRRLVAGHVLVLERDPVCGMPVEPEHAVGWEWAGETLYFCASGCREQFRREQETPSTTDTLAGYRRGTEER